MIISGSNLKSFYMKLNKHLVDLQYTFFHDNNKWNKNVRNVKMLSNV